MCPELPFQLFSSSLFYWGFAFPLGSLSLFPKFLLHFLWCMSVGDQHFWPLYLLPKCSYFTFILSDFFPPGYNILSWVFLVQWVLFLLMIIFYALNVWSFLLGCQKLWICWVLYIFVSLSVFLRFFWEAVKLPSQVWFFWNLLFKFWGWEQSRVEPRAGYSLLLKQAYLFPQLGAPWIVRSSSLADGRRLTSEPV